VSNPSPSTGDRPELLVVTRHQVAQGQRKEFVAHARLALATLAEHAGFLAGDLAQSTDDADEFVLQTRWSDVGAFRRALSSFDVKLNAVPLLSTAVDHTSAHEVVVSRSAAGETFVRSGLADDAREIGLGEASGPSIPSATP
jgi:quinol monooxygenase YgiN